MYRLKGCHIPKGNMNNPFFIAKINKINLINTSSQFIATAIIVLLLNTQPVYAAAINPDNIINLTNQARIIRLITPLKQNENLTQAAQQKAQDMLKLNYFEHYSPLGTTPWDFMLANNYDYMLAGENLAMDFATAEGENNAWLNSPAHARNELNPDFSDIGVAVVQGQLQGHQTTLVVQMFGRQQSPFVSNLLNTTLVKTVSQLLGIK